MRYKQLVQKKLSELKNFVHSTDSALSQRRSVEEIKQQLEKILNKLQEVEVLINTEHES